MTLTHDNTTNRSIPELKSILQAINAWEKTGVKFLAQVSASAHDAMLHAMFHNGGQTKDCSALNAIVNKLGMFDQVPAQAKFKRWVEACSPWRWKAATKTKAATFKLGTVDKKGNRIPFSLNEEIFEVSFQNYKPAKSTEEKHLTLEALKRRLINLKATATGDNLDFKAAVEAILAEAQAPTQGPVKNVSDVIKGSGSGRGRKPKVTEQTEEQSEATAEKTTAETPIVPVEPAAA